MKNLALISILLLCLPAFHAAGEEVRDHEGVVERINEELEDFSSDGSGVALIVEVDGQVILATGSGWANRERKIPFTETTVAQIGSLTKQFTAAAILHLVSEGLIDLDDTLQSVFPEVEGKNGQITIHQLLTHSSGLPEYCGGDFSEMSLERLIGECVSGPLRFAPGAQSAYSNAGYSVLAAIVENVSGQSLEQYLHRYLLEPNGMDSTGYTFDDESGLQFARGYIGGNSGEPISIRITSLGDAWWNLKGNGGMQSSVMDMYRWHRVLQGDGDLDEDVRLALTSPHTDWDDGVAEGYGWFFRGNGTGRVMQMSHSGSDGVFFSYFWWRPEERVFFYIVGNSGEQPTLELTRAIRGVLRDAYVAR